MYCTTFKHPWKSYKKRDFSIAWAGRIDDWTSLLKVTRDWASHKVSVTEAINEIVNAQYSCFGLVVETETHCLAIADQVRSYPIYYVDFDSQIFLGMELSSPSLQRFTCNQDKDATLEFLLCGYVLGNRTLFQKINVLRAGELLSIDKSSGKVVVHRYFRYLPQKTSPIDESNLIKAFGDVLDCVFERIIHHANNRPIWLPLSGGVDSRLILCKLVEQGYKNVTAFSYGVNHNHEIKRAKKVANALGVRWLCVPSEVRNLRQLYQSETRKAYTDYAYGGHAVPVWMDFEALNWLVNHQKIPTDAIIINGYSGDFVFGGHIPSQLATEPKVSTLVNKLIEKHCSHFKSTLLNDTKQRIENEIIEELNATFGAECSTDSLCAFIEYWDWQERQVKAVVNGQRLYEVFGFDWLLPFWDKALLDFWETVPVPLRLNQNLHTSYLKKYDYKGLFQNLRSPDQLWTPKWRWVPLAGKLLEFAFGNEKKLEFYESMFYFGVHRFQLGLFGREKYNQTYRELRRPYVVPLGAMAQLDDVSLSYPEIVYPSND